MLSTESIRKLFRVSFKTAQFIVEQGEVPEISEFPEATPEADLLNIVMKTLRCDLEAAQQAIDIERGNYWDKESQEIVEEDEAGDRQDSLHLDKGRRCGNGWTSENNQCRKPPASRVASSLPPIDRERLAAGAAIALVGAAGVGTAIALSRRPTDKYKSRHHSSSKSKSSSSSSDKSKEKDKKPDKKNTRTKPKTPDKKPTQPKDKSRGKKPADTKPVPQKPKSTTKPVEAKPPKSTEPKPPTKPVEAKPPKSTEPKPPTKPVETQPPKSTEPKPPVPPEEKAPTARPPLDKSKIQYEVSKFSDLVEFFPGTQLSKRDQARIVDAFESISTVHSINLNSSKLPGQNRIQIGTLEEAVALAPEEARTEAASALKTSSGLLINKRPDDNPKGVIPVAIGVSPVKNLDRGGVGAGVVHELGHVLDYQVFGDSQNSALASDKTPEYVKLRKTLLESPELKELKEIKQGNRKAGGVFGRLGMNTALSQKQAEYLLHPAEVWGRAYTQYIADRSGDPNIRKAIEGARKSRGIGKLEQWDDFEPIAAAMDELFASRGMR